MNHAPAVQGLSLASRLSALVRNYIASPDPRLRIANAIALVVAGNQPFYPLYVWWIDGAAAAASLVTWLSTPFFAAVPAVGRRSATAAKIILVAAGLGNTAACVFMLGRSSGVELFYVPCLLVALAVFSGPARWYATIGAGAAVAASMTLVRFTGPDAGNADLVRLHAFSAAGLVAVLGYYVWKERPRPSRRPEEGPLDRKGQG